MTTKRQFDDQMPKWQPWTVERLVALIGGIGGLVALFVTFFKLDHLSADIQSYIFFVEMSLLCAGLLLYIYFTSRRKLHRYAQSTYFVHYVNHIIRDQVAAMEAGKSGDIPEILQDIVNAVANCFSILTAKRCRCCIQEIRPNSDVVTVVRDSITATQSANTDTGAHNIEANTDYSNIWYGKNGCPRFFISTNLVKLWSAGKYQNSSFNVYGQPETSNFLGFTYVKKWPLPYKATIVWPIRYMPEAAKWPILDMKDLRDLPTEKRPFVWGFLCIDCHSRRTFDVVHSPELGAAFADAIFTLLHAARMTAEKRSPISEVGHGKLQDRP
jgi:hypothetical protein